MSSGGITEFLVELNESDSLVTLKEAHRQKSPLIFKIDNYPTPLKTYIDNFSNKRAILSDTIKDIKISETKDVSIKFNVGTEVFFVKTTLKSHLNRYYFDMGIKILQLKRRKEPRYLIPKKWKQSASLMIQAPKSELVKCTVIDISLSGIRLEILPSRFMQPYKRDDIVKTSFQIYKRAEIATAAIIRFSLVRPNMSTLLGLEFANITNIQKERIANIIEDIGLFKSTNID